jgi:hypothetical protein
LNKHEKNYPSYKGEVLALAWADHSFRQHLHGTHFRLVTDHRPLKWLMDAHDLNGQYAQWQMMLQEYDFTIAHRAGVNHANADVMSRFPQQSSHDSTRAQLDADVAAYCGVWTPCPVARKMRESIRPHKHVPTIGDLAPKFDDILNGTSAYINQYHCADIFMRSDSAHMNRSQLQDSLDEAVYMATVQITCHVQQIAQRAYPVPPKGQLACQSLGDLE